MGSAAISKKQAGAASKAGGAAPAKSKGRCGRWVIAFITALGVAAVAARADSVAATFTSASSTTGTSAAINGMKFTVGPNSVTVTALGYYDLGDNGLAVLHTVGIYDSSQTLVAIADVPAGTTGTLQSDFRFTSITPVTLAANQSYVLAGTIGAGSANTTADAVTFGHVGDYTGLSIDPRIIIPDNAFVFVDGNSSASARTTLSYPSQPLPAGNSYFAEFGPNFELAPSAAPLPGTLEGGALLLAALIAARPLRRLATAARD